MRATRSASPDRDCASSPTNGTKPRTERGDSAEFPPLPTRSRGDAVPTVQRSRATRSQAFQAARARRPTHRLARGDWRSRIRHRPDPGGGAGNGRHVEAAPTVLIVDDEGSIRTICRVNLESDGL